MTFNIGSDVGNKTDGEIYSGNSPNSVQMPPPITSLLSLLFKLHDLRELLAEAFSFLSTEQQNDLLQSKQFECNSSKYF